MHTCDYCGEAFKNHSRFNFVCDKCREYNRIHRKQKQPKEQINQLIKRLMLKVDRELNR